MPPPFPGEITDLCFFYDYFSLRRSRMPIVNAGSVSHAYAWNGPRPSLLGEVLSFHGLADDVYA